MKEVVFEMDMQLSERERIVLALFADGLSYTEVANQLDLTGETLDEILSSVLRKLFAGSFMRTLEETVPVGELVSA